MSNYTIGSLFDGSGTAPLAATMLGMKPLWASEIEPFPIAVTKARFPKMKHLGDISKINGAEIEPVNVIIGGSPCTDLSIAGKQLGLKDGKQSHLFYEMIRIIREMREATHGAYPRFVAWENVPGAFSSNQGRDFLAVVEEFCRIADDAVHITRPTKWRNAGAVVGNGWSFAWRVIDAKHWGVPQRRRRIYAILDLGSERAGEILFERAGLPWDSEPRGEAGQGTPADAVGRADRGGGVVGAFCAGAAPAAGSIGYSERVAPTLKAGQCAFPMGAVVYAIDALSSNSMKSKNPHSGFHEEDYIKCLDTSDGNPSKNQGGNVIVQETVYALQGNGIDRSVGAGCNGAGWREGEMYTLNTIDRPAVVYSIDQQGGKGAANYDENVMCPILSNSHGTPHAVVFDARGNGDGDVAATLTGDHQNRVTDYTNIAAFEDYQYGGYRESDTLGTLRTSCGGGDSVVLKNRYIVRRLTPRECALLQGFPPDWCAGLETPAPTEEDIVFWSEVWETHRKIMGMSSKPKSKKQIIKWLRNPHSDSAEYKLWGNGVAQPCVCFVMAGIVWVAGV